MGRPKQHDDTTRDALLSAAEQLVERGGTGALSVRAVADEIGTTTRAVYSTFGSKEGLLGALAKRSFDMLRDAIDQLPRTRDPARDLVQAALTVFRPMAVEHPSLFRIAFLRAAPNVDLGPAVGDAARAGYELLTERVQRLADAELLGGRDVQTATRRVQRDVLRHGSDRVDEPGAARTRSPTGLARRVPDAHRRVPRSGFTTPEVAGAEGRLPGAAERMSSGPAFKCSTASPWTHCADWLARRVSSTVARTNVAPISGLVMGAKWSAPAKTRSSKPVSSAVRALTSTKSGYSSPQPTNPGIRKRSRSTKRESPDAMSAQKAAPSARSRWRVRSGSCSHRASPRTMRLKDSAVAPGSSERPYALARSRFSGGHQSHAVIGGSQTPRARNNSGARVAASIATADPALWPTTTEGVASRMAMRSEAWTSKPTPSAPAASDSPYPRRS